ncbi:MAG: rhomboid family intramembrane serine protease [Gammaproteobacteria bacterium]|nr:rhomboid family intramembrane serine protease [Gammaproteobacteria bacterium]
MPDYRNATILALMAVAVVVFFHESNHGLKLSSEHGAVPRDLSHAASNLLSGDASLALFGVLFTTVTALFLHGDAMHLGYNMVFLWAFGSLVVRHLGQGAALVVFLLTGVCGNVLQTFLKPDSAIPIIGASGAVYGFEGIYLGLALRWTLPWPDVWPLAHPIPPLQLGVFAVLGVGFDIYLLMNRQQGVAYGAHVGGFLAGLAIAAIVTQVFPSEQKYERAGWKR